VRVEPEPNPPGPAFRAFYDSTVERKGERSGKASRASRREDAAEGPRALSAGTCPPACTTGTGRTRGDSWRVPPLRRGSAGHVRPNVKGLRFRRGRPVSPEPASSSPRCCGCPVRSVGNIEGTPARARACTSCRSSSAIPFSCAAFVPAASRSYLRFPARCSMVRRGSPVRVRNVHTVEAGFVRCCSCRTD
jgi:hypothetical protein